MGPLGARWAGRWSRNRVACIELIALPSRVDGRGIPCRSTMALRTLGMTQARAHAFCLIHSAEGALMYRIAVAFLITALALGCHKVAQPAESTTKGNATDRSANG